MCIFVQIYTYNILQETRLLFYLVVQRSSKKKITIKKDGDRNNVASRIYNTITDVSSIEFLFLVSCLCLSNKAIGKFLLCLNMNNMKIVNNYKYLFDAVLHASIFSESMTSSSFHFRILKFRTTSQKKTANLSLLRRRTRDLKNRFVLPLIMSDTRDKRN